MNEAAFLGAILDNPNDDDLRLVFADWLADHDEPNRGEFLRTQVALARMDADDPRRAGSTAREQALLAQHKAAWLGSSWSESLTGVRFWRGLVHEVTIHPRLLYDSAEDFFRLFPLVRQVRFYQTSDRVQELLNFHHEPKEYYAELLRSPYMARLEMLSLRDNQVGDEAVIALAGSPHVAGLKSLDLSINQIGDAGAQALAASPYLTQLTELALGENRVGQTAREALMSQFGQRVRFASEWGRSSRSWHQRYLSDWLDCAVILDEHRARSREQVIEQLLAELVDRRRLAREALGSACSAILRREQLGSTGIGRGVAIPHNKHESLSCAVGILGLVPKGVDFDSLDGEPVHIIVLFLYPGNICDYTLPQSNLLMERLRQDSFCRRLRQAASVAELMEVLHGLNHDAS
jgi:uncharacterized protein (TIGR02996 family)